MNVFGIAAAQWIGIVAESSNKVEEGSPEKARKKKVGKIVVSMRNPEVVI